jgi:beta-mannosidase
LGRSKDNGTQTYLVFDGLDTFTYIEFCGTGVGNANNQFRQFYFDVADILASCNQSNPTLSLNFGSASKIVLELAATGDRKQCSAMENQN